MTTVVPKNFIAASAEQHVVETKDDYVRYALTKNGVSPRGIPGYGTGLVGVDSDEHDTMGHITESNLVRLEQHGKRLRKIDGLRSEVLPTLISTQSKKAKTLIVTWGSNIGVVEEALDVISDKSFGHIHFVQVYPLDPKAKKYFDKAEKIVVVENNASGQFANLLEAEYGITVNDRVLKYDGNPFSVEELVTRFKKL